MSAQMRLGAYLGLNAEACAPKFGHLVQVMQHGLDPVVRPQPLFGIGQSVAPGRPEAEPRRVPVVYRGEARSAGNSASDRAQKPLPL